MARWPDPGGLPAARQVAVYAESITLVGRVLRRLRAAAHADRVAALARWRWWARVTAVAPVIWLVAKALVPRPLYPPFESVPNPFAVHVLVGPLRAVWAAASIVMNLGLVVAVASLVVRFHGARGIERQQLRWVALAAGLSVIAAVLALAEETMHPTQASLWLRPRPSPSDSGGRLVRR